MPRFDTEWKPVFLGEFSVDVCIYYELLRNVERLKYWNNGIFVTNHEKWQSNGDNYTAYNMVKIPICENTV